MISFADGERDTCAAGQLEALGYQVTGDKFAIGRPDRPTIRVRTPDGRSAVAKVYPPGGAKTVFDQWQCVWNSSFGRQRTPPGLPEPLACLSEFEVLLTEFFPGQPLAAIPSRDVAFDAAVRLIAELHGSDVQPARRRTSRGILRSLERKFELVATVAPRQAEPMRRVLAMLASAMPGDEQLVPSHGDCSPRNVLVSVDRCVLIDWDRLQVADPARDVAYFGLWNWKQDLRQGRAPDRRPLERTAELYEACRSGARIRNRLRFHTAAGLVRQAASIVQLWPNEMDLVPRLLELAKGELS